FLNRAIRLVWPTIALAAAMCFHRLAGWLLPSLLYLFWIDWKERPRPPHPDGERRVGDEDRPRDGRALQIPRPAVEAGGGAADVSRALGGPLCVNKDWNLFAIGGGLFVWRRIGSLTDAGLARLVAVGLAATYALHTYSWIAANHAIVP